jgi:hypothetical protein
MHMSNGVKSVFDMVSEHSLSKILNFPILICYKSWTIFYLGFGIHCPMLIDFFVSESYYYHIQLL